MVVYKKLWTRVNNIMKEHIKIKYKPNDQTFNERERTMNVEIQKMIDFYRQKGCIVLEHKVYHKTSTHAMVEFSLKKMLKVR